MVKMTKQIIPCLDIKEGRVVKGKKFKNIQDVADPLTVAINYENQGADALFVLDISGKERSEFLTIIQELTSELTIPVTVGGGVRSLEDVDAVLNAGAKKVSITSAAIEDPQLLKQAAEKYGSERIVLSIDAKQINETTWHAFKQGGTVDSGLDVIKWAKEGEDLGVGEILLNSIDTDGVKDGFQINLNKAVSEALTIPVIASGGAGDFDDFLTVFTKTNVKSALAASVFHYNEINIKELKNYLESFAIPVRSFDMLEKIKFDKQGLVPVVVQDVTTKQVLMLAYMNKEAYLKTIETKETWFYSRSRRELWHKGATSGNKQTLVSMSLDCDGDTLLVNVTPHGPACHTGAESCFFNPIIEGEKASHDVIQRIVDTIESRKKYPDEDSYTNYLFDKGIDKVLKKMGEEASEVIIGAKNNDRDEIKWEVSDLVYHTLVLLNMTNVSVDEIKDVLYERHIEKKDGKNE